MTNDDSDQTLDEILTNIWNQGREHTSRHSAVEEAKALLYTHNYYFPTWLLNEYILSELEKVANNNYAEEFGTYDFDGIAEDVFERIGELKASQEGKND